MLCDNDEIVTDSNSVANIFKKYFMEMADSIGFNDPIPFDFHSDHILKAMVAKYDDYPSIKAIKNHLPDRMTSNFGYVIVNELCKILVKLDTKKATVFYEIPSKFLLIGAAQLAVPIAHIVNLSI